MQFLRKFCIFLIILYQNCISPFFPKRCNFIPSCSEYTKQAIKKYGVIKGIILGVKRICKCHNKSKISNIFDPLE